MIRELVLVAADLSACPWFALGTPPRAELAADLTVQTIADPAAAERFAGSPLPPGEARTRLTEGDRCVVVADTAGKLVSQLWLSKAARHLDWIGCAVAPQDGALLLYNAWVDPAQRGRGAHWAMARQACAETVAMGFTKISAGVERHEFQPFAHKYAEMGLAVIVPYASLWCWPAVALRVTLRPPRLLVDFSKSLTCASP